MNKFYIFLIISIVLVVSNTISYELGTPPQLKKEIKETWKEKTISDLSEIVDKDGIPKIMGIENKQTIKNRRVYFWLNSYCLPKAVFKNNRNQYNYPYYRYTTIMDKVKFKEKDLNFNGIKLIFKDNVFIKALIGKKEFNEVEIWLTKTDDGWYHQIKDSSLNEHAEAYGMKPGAFTLARQTFKTPIFYVANPSYQKIGIKCARKFEKSIIAPNSKEKGSLSRDDGLHYSCKKSPFVMVRIWNNKRGVPRVLIKNKNGYQQVCQNHKLGIMNYSGNAKDKFGGKFKINLSFNQNLFLKITIEGFHYPSCLLKVIGVNVQCWVPGFGKLSFVAPSTFIQLP